MLKKLFNRSAPVENVGVLERAEPTISNITDGEVAPSSDRVKMFEIFGDPTTSAGAVVNDKTSMRVSAVYSCVALIAGSIAQLPLPVYERNGSTRTRVDHDYWWVLNEQFSPAWSASAGWEFLSAQMLLQGDGIAYIMRNRAGDMTGLIPWARTKVDIFLQERSSARSPKRLGYRFHDDEKGYFTADQDDVLHLPGFGFNGECSMSVIQWGARNGIGIALQGDDHAGRFFSEGGKPEVAIKAPGEMSPGQQDDFRAAWMAKYGGVTGNRKIPLILTEGLDVSELTMSAIDQQLLESRQWQVVDIARAFGVPPHMIGETTKSTSFGSGVENMGIGYVKYTLGSHLRRFKDEMNRKLYRTTRYFVEHNVDGLMAGDSKAQALYFGKALGGPGAQGWMSVNEVRRLKNLPPSTDPADDKVFRQSEKGQPSDKDDDEDTETTAASA